MSLNKNNYDNKIIYPNKNIKTPLSSLKSQNQRPLLIHQKSFASIRQFVLSNNYIKQKEEEQDNQIIQKLPRFSSIRRRKKIENEEETSKSKNGKKRIPSVRKVGICYGKEGNLDWRSKSVVGLKSTNNNRNSPIIEQRKYSLTLLSQKAKKSMQRKLSELTKNDSNFFTQTIGKIIIQQQQSSLDKQQQYYLIDNSENNKSL